MNHSGRFTVTAMFRAPERIFKGSVAYVHRQGMKHVCKVENVLSKFEMPTHRHCTCPPEYTVLPLHTWSV